MINLKFFPKCILVIGLFLSISSKAQNFSFGKAENPDGVSFNVDSKGFIINDKRKIPVMGEIHYSRVPENEWRREIQKMRAGGITILSTYVFWSHHEVSEGIWDWSGNRNLHAFLEICRDEQMPVVLRVGPFCHGEVYQGGMADWIVERSLSDRNYKLRSQASGFMGAVERLYSNIFAQVSGLQWKDGGPVVGVQIENECRGPWGYYDALRTMAIRIGFDVPFMTRTGWPKLNGKEEFGKLLPLYGDYVDGFWDRTLDDMPGDYPKAFIMKDTRVSAVIATETFGTNQDTKMDKNDLAYPYLTCELGGGMMPSYHRRINIKGTELVPLAICKLGSGSNLPGYYMYHGGTNPSSLLHTMAETQNSNVTNYNDMPLLSYDFQAPLGEMGQPNYESFHDGRILHQMLADWGDELSVMDVDTLSEHYSRRGSFEFYNDYVRILNEKGVAWVKPKDLVFCSHKLSADAQPFCKMGNTIVLVEIAGVKPTVTIDGRRYSLKVGKTLSKSGLNVVLLSRAKARTAYKVDDKLCFADGILYRSAGKLMLETWQTLAANVTVCGEKAHGGLRDVVMGRQKVASMPTDSDFEKAAVWDITIPDTFRISDDKFLSIDYCGDVARVYADGKLVADNFWNGKKMLVRLSDLVGKSVKLCILPLGKNYPIYLQSEQRKQLDSADGSLLRLNGVSLVVRKDVEFVE